MVENRVLISWGQRFEEIAEGSDELVVVEAYVKLDYLLDKRQQQTIQLSSHIAAL